MTPTVRARFVRRSTGVACDSGRHRYEIVHRASGRVVGYVAPWAADFALNGRRIWNAYTAAPGAEDAAINGNDEWIEDAILAVIDPNNCRPPDHRGDNTMQPDLRLDEVGSRAKYPEAWEFYDWLVSVTAEINPDDKASP